MKEKIRIRVKETLHLCSFWSKVSFTSSALLEVFMKNKIKELREEAKLTQQELGEKLTVSRQTIISLENGKYNPSIILAFKIANIFGRSIEEIFIYEEE